MNNIKKIKNILICGLGAIGTICASSIIKNKEYNLKILIDENRLNKYSTQPTIFNEEEYFFDYILPTNSDFKADLIIISTKNDGLNDAIKNIKNFITDKTIIISLLNGIHSEQEIINIYPKANVITSFYIGNSSIRKDREITHDGVYKIFFDEKDKNSKFLKEVFDKTKIKYEISNNIKEEYWKKFIINVGLNQLCAVENKTLNEIKKDTILIKKLIQLMNEAKQVAQQEEKINAEKLYQEAKNFILNEMPEATPSMLQDILNNRKTEVDIFAGKVIELGIKHKIETPINKEIFNKIKKIEKGYKKIIKNLK